MRKHKFLTIIRNFQYFILFTSTIIFVIFFVFSASNIKRAYEITTPGDNFILVSLFAVISLSFNFTTLLNQRIEDRTKPDTKIGINDRIDLLTNALKTASDTIYSLEMEIEERQKLVEKLETQKAIAEQAITLSKEQVDAVSAILKEQVALQSNIDSRKDTLKDFGFMIGGAILGVLTTLWLS